MGRHRLQRLSKDIFNKRFIPVVAVVLLSLGAIGIAQTRAATDSVGIEPEEQTLTGTVFVGHDNHAGASNEHYVSFGLNPPVAVNNQLQQFATGLNKPTGVVVTGVSGDTRMFATEQPGTIRIVRANGSVDATPFLNIVSKVASGGERGFLGLVFHPQYSSNRQFYVYYTDLSGNLTISRFLRDASNAEIADASSELKLFVIPHSQFSNHNGGGLAFGPKDGYLYISVGDGGSSGDPNNNAQNKDSLLGKILRVDVNSGSPYGIPQTNPFVNQTGADEVWAFGLRNPWRFSFDRVTGDMFIADVGQNAWEEISFQAHGTPGGVNYGWRCYEGTHNYNTTGCGPLSSYKSPIYEYDHSSGRCSITGGYPYRGQAYPELLTQYLFADYCSGHLYKLAKNANGTWSVASQTQFSGLNISSFGEDSSGELYLVSLTNGIMYKLSASH